MSAHAIRAAIGEALREQASRPGGRPLTLEAMAGDLHSSRSTLQRTLAAAGTSFTIELRAARALAAVRAIHTGRSAAVAAARVGVSPDYLRVLLLKEYGIAPGPLRRCVTIAGVLRRWERRPAAADSPLYWKRLRQWSAYERELRRHLHPVRQDSPLRPWADALLSAARRPDYRRGAHRALARAQRRSEREQRRAFLDDILARMREGRSAA